MAKDGQKRVFRDHTAAKIIKKSDHTLKQVNRLIKEQSID